jgi:type II secretory pathway pseudopilin PulG
MKYINISKKGAMFGLDARIALAIFGALSVISGAALYSAIKDAKATAQLTQLREIVKASEAYYLDNGKNVANSNNYSVYSADLVTNRENLNTWKGPYLSYTRYNDYSINSNLGANLTPPPTYSLRFLKADTWPVNNVRQLCVFNNNNCTEWVVLASGNTADAKEIVEDIFNLLDEKVDDSDGEMAGNVRAIYYGGTSYELHFKSIPRKNLVP